MFQRAPDVPTILLAVFALMLLAVTGAAAERRAASVHGIGPRVGLSVDPDQVHFGGHMDLGDVANNLSLMPSVEAGFGNDLTIVTVMADLAYRFPGVSGGWAFYAGAGIGPVFISADHGHDDTEIGLTAQGGVARRRAGSNTLFFELRLGLVDTPDFKLTAGWTFGS